VSDDLSIPTPTYRVPRHRRGMDPLTKRLALIACGLGGPLVVVVGSWSMLNHHGGTVPVIEADSGPVRVKPANPGGMQITGANDDVLSGDGNAADDKLAPPPEAPAPQALRAAPARPATAPVPVPAAPPAVIAAAPVKPIESKPVPAPDQHAAATAPTEKDTLVQLAAVRSEADAKSEWERLAKRMPDLLAQRHPAISKTDHDGHTLWRVRTGGFTDLSQAKDFCERVRAKGAGCTVAEF
jgi:hypothetical protein